MCLMASRGLPRQRWTPYALTPNTVELIPTLGALFPRGGPVQDPVLTDCMLQPPEGTQGWGVCVLTRRYPAIWNTIRPSGPESGRGLHVKQFKPSKVFPFCSAAAFRLHLGTKLDANTSKK